MPVRLELQTDGGIESFKIGIAQTAQGMESFKKLFEMFVQYFEGKTIPFKKMMGNTAESARVVDSELIPMFKDPILSIYETEGRKIGADWKTTDRYETWKQKNWESKREFDVKIGFAGKQVLTGHTLHAFLNGEDPWAIRKLEEKSMEYGIENDYTKKFQYLFRVIDFFPEMLKDMRRIVGAFVRNAGAVAWEGEE